MQSEMTRSLLAWGQPSSDGLRALGAVIRREWTIFSRYPCWIIALFIWPLIFPTGLHPDRPRPLRRGRQRTGATSRRHTGLTEYIGYIAIGTMIWMWQNIVLWNVGYSLRNEQMRGTLESNWLSPTWRFSYLLGASVPQLVSMLMFIIVTALEYRLDLRCADSTAVSG